MWVTARSAAAKVSHLPCAARLCIHKQHEHACVLCNRAGLKCLYRALRRCRQPRSLPDAQEDIERLLGGGIRRCLDEAELQLAGTPLRNLQATE
jgi:hypothetical protein